jgi:hypothetical protein
MYGKVQEDIQRYEMRIEEMRKLGDRLEEANNLRNLGAVYSTEPSVINFSLAAHYCEQARQIYRELESWYTYAKESNNLATIYEYEEGFDDPWRALEVCEDTLTTGGIYIPDEYRARITRRIPMLKEKIKDRRGY